MKNLNVMVSDAKQRARNTRLIENFILAFTAYDLKYIGSILASDGIFFGYNKAKGMSILFALLRGEKSLSSYPMVNVNRGVSLGKYPGAEVVEFRFSENYYDILPAEQWDEIPPLGSPPVKNYKEVVIRFVFVFKNDKISRLDLAKHFSDRQEDFEQMN
jgi:hypothetical protein